MIIWVTFGIKNSDKELHTSFQHFYCFDMNVLNFVETVVDLWCLHFRISLLSGSTQAEDCQALFFSFDKVSLTGEQS